MAYPLSKQVFLHAAKHAGFFSFARRSMRRCVRILCYHGVAAQDEHLWRPALFIEPWRLTRRLDFLRDGRYPVISLDNAVRGLQTGGYPDHAVVLTMDDGFAASWENGISQFTARGLPATVYVTTYHMQKGTPVFRLALRYLLWKTEVRRLDCSGLNVPRCEGIMSWQDTAGCEAIAALITDYAENILDEPGRMLLLENIGTRIGADAPALKSAGLFSIMDTVRVRAASRAGIDIQLHTHRHRFPPDQSAAQREIDDNRAAFAGVVDAPCDHLCYPSGRYHMQHFEMLHSLGIRSATTCDIGLNRTGDNPLALRRFLDSSVIPDIVFEAELCGFLELLRRRVRGSR